jgi:hypothetical protein
MNPVNAHLGTGIALGEATWWLCFELAILTLTMVRRTQAKYEALLALKPSHQIPSRDEASA